MSVASEITRLQTAKADLKTAIEGKGVTVASSAKLDAYPALVESISGGSIEDLITKENLVRIEGELSDLAGGVFVLDASNNFNKTYPFLSNSFMNNLAFNFNGTNIGFVDLTDKSTKGILYVLLTVGSTMLKFKSDNSYVGGYKHVYFYINDEIVGTINYDD